MGWFSDRTGKGRLRGNGQSEPAAELAVRLNRQRAKWLERVAAECRDAATVVPEMSASATDLDGASAVASAFQAVHVLSFGHANNYVAANDMGRFTTTLCERLTDGRVTDKWKNAVEHYTDLKAKPLQEQLLNFSEEIAISLSGSAATGMMLGPGLLPLANEFLLRSLGIAACFFGDEHTTREMAAAVLRVHEDHPAEDTVPLPEWLEEKATDAPTMFRIVMDAIDLRLRREYPHVLACDGWNDFRQAGTIGGCVALALQLDVDVPEGYRTSLERVMRASLELGFPRSEGLYEDCVRCVREALVEIPRPKMRGASMVLISMWVFGVVGDGDSLIKDAHIVAELAQVYQSEVNGFWAPVEDH